MYPIAEVTKKLLRGGTVMADCGTKLYTPDGFGFYKALWGRDFAYILSAAGEFIPAEEMKAAIEFLMAGAREDGWIPDRVEPDGVARYTAGDEHFPASPNLDTGPFLVIAADVYLRQLEEKAACRQFEEWQNGLQRSLDCLPVDENGLITGVGVGTAQIRAVVTYGDRTVQTNTLNIKVHDDNVLEAMELNATKWVLKPEEEGNIVKTVYNSFGKHMDAELVNWKFESWDPEILQVDEKTGVLKRDGIASKMNPYDLYALETALRLREKNGGKVVVFSSEATSSNV